MTKKIEAYEPKLKLKRPSSEHRIQPSVLKNKNAQGGSFEFGLQSSAATQNQRFLSSRNFRSQYYLRRNASAQSHTNRDILTTNSEQNEPKLTSSMLQQ